METRLRQRMIGGVVLAALAIIFLPLFFKNSNAPSPHQAPVIVSDQIPAQPPQPSEKALNQPVDNRVVTLTSQGDSMVATVSEAPANPMANQAMKQNTPAAPAPAAPTTANAMDSDSDHPAKQNVFSNTQPGASDNVQPVTQQSVTQQTSTQQPTMQQTQPAAPQVAASAPAQQAPVTNGQVKTNEEATVTKSLNAAEDKVLAEKPEVAAKQEEKPVMLKTKPNPKAITLGSWAVQLGAFTDEVNAKKLIKQLQAKGFAAYLEKVKTNKGAMVRVLIGPEAKKAKAQTIVAKLDKQMQLKGVVVPYEVPLFNK